MVSVPTAACQRLVWIALFALVVAAGCQREARLGWIDRILVSEADLGSHPWLGLSADELGRGARSALQQRARIGFVAPGEKAPGNEEPWSGRVDLVYVRTLPPVIPPGEGEVQQTARTEVAVELSLTRPGGGRLVGEGRAQQEFRLGEEGSARSAAARVALEAALGDAAEQLGLQLETARMDDEALVAQLAATEGRRRDAALRVLAERRSPLAVPHLLERLSASDRTVQLRAVGGLVAVGDPGSVPALIDATLGMDPSFVVQVIYALGEIGGPDAEAYLFTASTGHGEEVVRRAASEALEGMRSERHTETSRRTAR